MNRTNPYDLMEQFFERMSHEFDDLPRSGMTGGRFGMGSKALSLDIADEDDAFEVTVDVPGFDREEIDVRVADDTLTITAEHERESEADEGAFIHRERAHRTLTRSVDLPADIDETAVEARLTNGVLTITLPKVATDEESYSIDIE